MIIFVLIFLIAFLSLLQEEKRRMTALLFVLLTLIHTIIWAKAPDDGFLYFLSATVNDLIIMIVIANLPYTTKLTDNLMKISFCFIIINFIGWIMWMSYLDLALYQYAASLLYISVIVALLNWDGIEDGNHTMDGWINSFRINNMASYYNYKKL